MSMSLSVTRSMKCVAHRSSVCRPCTPLKQQKHQTPARHMRSVAVRASDDEEDGPGAQKKLQREEEPEEYWVTPSERKGANAFKDPVAIMGIVAILLPFLLLGGAIATGVIDTSVYR